MNLVVLPLDHWMNYEMYYDDCGVVKCPPVYGRNRIFMIGDRWWFENNGSGYTYETPEDIKSAIIQTKFQLATCEESILRKCEADALQSLVHFNKDPILRKRVLRTLNNHIMAVQIRETGRMTRKFML